MREMGEDGRDDRRMEGRGLSLAGELSLSVGGLCRGERMEDYFVGRIEKSETVSSVSMVDNAGWTG
jgi:hypothetical protein